MVYIINIFAAGSKIQEQLLPVSVKTVCNPVDLSYFVEYPVN